ncbi:MAG TPA: phosphotransferase [Micromonosporaceae bacterium]|nr:phosphotransferase [Micromonosporaceae bacterium]
MPFATTPLTDATIAAAARAWDLPLDGTPVRLYGGEDSAAYRVGDVVLRIGPAERGSAEIEWCHGIAAHAAARLAEPIVPLPVRTPSGATVARVDGRPVSLWPHVDGEWLDADDTGQRRAAARLLARLHRALAAAEPPPRPCPSLMDPGLYEPFPATDDPLADPVLDAWLADRAGHPRHPLHGDWYRGNLLIADGGRIAAILDWDEAWTGPPEFEVAAAAREYGSHWDTDLTAARRFVDDYLDAGGTAPPLSDDELAQLIRHRLRCEVAAAERYGHVPDADDIAYHRRQVDLFTRLRPA